MDAILYSVLVVVIVALACMFAVERVTANELRNHAKIHAGDLTCMTIAHAKQTAELRAAVADAEERLRCYRSPRELPEQTRAEAPATLPEPSMRPSGERPVAMDDPTARAPLDELRLERSTP